MIMGTIKLYMAVVTIVIVAMAAYGVVLADVIVKNTWKRKRLALAVLLIVSAMFLV